MRDGEFIFTGGLKMKLVTNVAIAVKITGIVKDNAPKPKNANNRVVNDLVITRQQFTIATFRNSKLILRYAS